jgi:transcriptional regulator with XRE-family HTH domain
MSYGHAEKIAAITAAMAARSEKPTAAVDPTLYRRDDVRAVLAAHDIAGLYQLLKDAGLTQRDIAALTGQSQSEVSEILTGRRVLSYDLLVRITEGLAIPRELMGLSWWGPEASHPGPDGAYRGEVTVTDPERVAEMLRRHVIALGPIAAIASNPLAKLAELLEHLELPGPSPVPLPSRLSAAHVVKVRDLTRRLGEAGNTSVSAPEVLPSRSSRR